MRTFIAATIVTAIIILMFHIYDAILCKTDLYQVMLNIALSGKLYTS